jgi:hypothetical protein
VNLTVTNNNLHDNISGIYALSISGGLFEGNTIRTSPAATALTFAGKDTNIQVLMNDMSNNARGLRITDFGDLGGCTPNRSIVANCNNFADDSDFGVGIVDGAFGNPYSGTLDVTKNWWGSVTGPTVAGNPGGTGSKIRNDFNDPITYSPWATSPDCTIRHGNDSSGGNAEAQKDQVTLQTVMLDAGV